MKKLSEFIKEENLTIRDIVRNAQRRSSCRTKILNFFGESLDNICPISLIDKVAECYINNSENFDFILETVNSHDFVKINKALREYLGDRLIDIEKMNDNEKIDSFEIIFKYSDDLYKNVLKNKKFLSIIEYYGYFISGVNFLNFQTREAGIKKIEEIENLKDYIYPGNAILLCVEPKYTRKANDILKKSHNICYHFTDNESAKSILKSGLRCKVSNYREYPERIYLYCDTNVTDKNGNIKPEIKEVIGLVCNEDTINKYGLAILKIDFNHIPIDVYKDTMMDDEKSVFVYNNIPPSYITKINFK